MIHTESHEVQIHLSVCVIGRNEAKNLPACIESFKLLRTTDLLYETIFVDSSSTDDSVAVAEQGFDKIVCLPESPHLNAGLARHLGTLQAKGIWTLYLDGDMELAADILPAIRALVTSNLSTQGLCGFTQNFYPDGSSDVIRFAGNIDGSPCKIFGGAVLLPTAQVLKSGNWACELYAYEEMELYSRLLKNDVKVIWSAQRMVIHHTPKVSTFKKLSGSVLPFRSFLGKKFYGAGQATAYSLVHGNIGLFIKLKPDPYMMIASFWMSLISLSWVSWSWIVIPSVSFLITLRRLGLKGAVNATCWLVQVPVGFLVYFIRPVSDLKSAYKVRK
jgi:glycosyltransferase involved in cell wall biosynthesis